MQTFETPGAWVAHKLYTVQFEDTFSFATSTRTDVPLTDDQYQIALKQMKNKSVVVSRFDVKQAIHMNLIIKSITLQK